MTNSKTKRLKNLKLVCLISGIILLVASIFYISRFYSSKTYLSDNQILSVDGIPQIPIYPEAELINLTKDPRELVLYQVSWKVNSPIQLVSVWYTNTLKKSGWKPESIPSDTGESEIQNLQFSKDDYLLSISLEKNTESGTNIITAEFVNKSSVLSL